MRLSSRINTSQEPLPAPSIHTYPTHPRRHEALHCSAPLKPAQDDYVSILENRTSRPHPPLLPPLIVPFSPSAYIQSMTPRAGLIPVPRRSCSVRCFPKPARKGLDRQEGQARVQIGRASTRSNRLSSTCGMQLCLMVSALSLYIYQPQGEDLKKRKGQV